MDDTEAKVRCLELAATVSRAVGDHSPESIVKFATVFYSFIQLPDLLPEPVADPVDKPKRKMSKADILS